MSHCIAARKLPVVSVAARKRAASGAISCTISAHAVPCTVSALAGESASNSSVAEGAGSHRCGAELLCVVDESCVDDADLHPFTGDPRCLPCVRTRRMDPFAHATRDRYHARGADHTGCSWQDDGGRLRCRGRRAATATRRAEHDDQQHPPGAFCPSPPPRTNRLPHARCLSALSARLRIDATHHIVNGFSIVCIHGDGRGIGGYKKTDAPYLLWRYNSP